MGSKPHFGGSERARRAFFSPVLWRRARLHIWPPVLRTLQHLLVRMEQIQSRGCRYGTQAQSGSFEPIRGSDPGTSGGNPAERVGPTLGRAAFDGDARSSRIGGSRDAAGRGWTRWIEPFPAKTGMNLEKSRHLLRNSGTFCSIMTMSATNAARSHDGKSDKEGGAVVAD